MQFFKKFFLLSLILFSGCSFDNRSGIWTGDIEKKKIKSQENLKELFKEKKPYNIEKGVESNFKFVRTDQAITFKNWQSEFNSDGNNIPNIFYESNLKNIFTSSKISKGKINENILVHRDNLIFSNNTKIYVYSLLSKKIIFEYNFYKKFFKKYEKKLFFSLYKDKIYVADNLGYLYSLDYLNNKLSWAKNYGNPFRSNIKFYKNNLFVSDIDNNIYAINISDGSKIWNFNTENNLVKTDFLNNFAHYNNFLYFLNNNGNLYSFNLKNRYLRWVLDTKISTDLKSLNFLQAKPLVVNKNSILVTTTNKLSLYNSNASGLWQFYFEAKLKPIVSNQSVFVLGKNNFLICLDIIDGKVIWSKELKKLESTLIGKKINKINNIEKMLMLNNKLYLFTNNGMLMIINKKNGKLESHYSLKKINSKVIVVDNKLMFINSKNKLEIYN